MTGDIYKDAFI